MPATFSLSHTSTGITILFSCSILRFFEFWFWRSKYKPFIKAPYVSLPVRKWLTFSCIVLEFILADISPRSMWHSSQWVGWNKRWYIRLFSAGPHSCGLSDSGNWGLSAEWATGSIYFPFLKWHLKRVGWVKEMWDHQLESFALIA